MDSLDDSSMGHHSVGSACNFQVQLMRCGFLPQNSVSSFDLKDLSDLDFNDNSDPDGAHQNDDISEATTSTNVSSERQTRCRSASPTKARAAPARRGLRATLSLRLSRRFLLDDEEETDSPASALPRAESRGSLRNQGLRRRAERGVANERMPVRRQKSCS
jgi:hypothetical protein